MTTYKITGNTYAFASKLKGLGCTWDKDGKCWLTTDPKVAQDLQDPSYSARMAHALKVTQIG